MEYALLDEHLSYFTQEKFSDCIKHYAVPLYTVEKHVPKGSKDHSCAEYCIEHECDFITADKKAFDEIFKLKKIKSIEIKQILEREPTIDRPVYSLSFRTK